MVKVRWTGEPRALADPQVEVKKGDEFDVPAADAKSFADQGLAERVDTTAKKEND
jgi:hypothetical protein